MAIQNFATTDAGILESLIHNPPIPPRVIALLERRAAAPFHSARSPGFQPHIDDNCKPVSHSGNHRPYATALSPWAASISVQLSLSQGFQPRHPPAPPTARPHRRLARPRIPALRRYNKHEGRETLPYTSVPLPSPHTRTPFFALTLLLPVSNPK